MANRERIVALKITADSTGAQRAGQTLVSGFVQAAREISRSFSSIDKLDGLRDSITTAGTQLQRLQDELRDVGAEILKTDGNAARVNALRQQYRGLEVEIAQVGRSLDRDTASALKLEAAMRSAGLSTQFGAARVQFEGMANSLERARSDVNAIRANAQNLFGGIGDVGSAQVGVQAELAALRQRNVLIGAGTELERVERGIVLGNYAAYSSAQLAHLRQLAIEYDAKQALLNVERERIAAALAQRAAVGNFAGAALSAGGVGFAGGAAGAGLAVGAGLMFASQQALELERNQAALKAVTGSLAAARAEMAFLRDQSDRLGVGITDMTRSWVQLEAASKGSALEGQKARDVFLAITEASQRLNLAAPETEGALRAIGQMMSKGTVQSEELRGQLGDRLPGAFNIMARALGVTTAELGEMLKAGEVLAADALPKFAAELRKTFDTDITTRIETTTAAFTRLQNEAKLTGAAVGGVLNPALKEAAEAGADYLLILRELPAVAGAAMFLPAAGRRLIADELRESATEAARFRSELDRIASAPAFSAEARDKAILANVLAFDPLANGARDSDFYGPGKPSQSLQGAELLGAGGKVNVEREMALRRELALLGEKSELAKVEYEIAKGELRTASETEKVLARQAAIKKDMLAAAKVDTKREKQDDKSLEESNKAFRESVAAEAKVLEQQAAFRRQLGIETLEAQGSDTQAALAKLRDQYAAFSADLASSAEGLDLAAKWFNASEARIALDRIASEARKAVADLQQRVQARDLRAASSSPAERDRLRAENQADVAGTRRAVMGNAGNGAMFGGDTDKPFSQGITEATTAIDNMAESIRRANEGPIAQLFRDWSEGAANMQRAAASWIGSTTDGIAELVAKGKTDFRSLGESIIQDIIRIQLQSAIANMASGGAGSALTQGVGDLFARLFTPSMSATGVVTRADGGMVNGPGTSTSDSIPALLSNGEFVINAKAVRMFGRDTFEGLNRGFRPAAVRRFADGGYVGGGAALAASGAPANIVIENHTGAEVTTERTQRGGVDIERIVISALKRDVAQNGDYSRLMSTTFGLTRKPGR